MTDVSRYPKATMDAIQEFLDLLETKESLLEIDKKIMSLPVEEQEAIENELIVISMCSSLEHIITSPRLSAIYSAEVITMIRDFLKSME